MKSHLSGKCSNTGKVESKEKRMISNKVVGSITVEMSTPLEDMKDQTEARLL